MKTTNLKSSSGSTIEFVDGLEQQPPKLIIGVFGQYTGGKSRFGVTGPDVCGIIPTDRKTRKTVQNTIDAYKQAGIKKRVLMPKEDFVRQVNPMQVAFQTNEEVMKHYRDHVNRVKDAAFALHAHSDVQCITIDLFSQFYLDMCYAHYGKDSMIKKIGEKTIKDKSEANTEVIDFINTLASKHLILTNKNKDEYFKNKPTGRDTWEGFKFLGNHCNVMIELDVNPKWKPAENGDSPDWHFGLNLRAAQDRVDIPQDEQLLTDEMINFENLATYLYPEVEWGK